MDELPLLLGNNKKHTVWDDYIPILTDGNTIDVYLNEGIIEPPTYSELCHKLRKASALDTFNLHINNGGGMIDTAVMIIAAIEESEAHVVAHLTGTVASAATMIALSCDELQISKNLAFMIHNYSAGTMGKGNELKARQKFMDESLERAFNDFYSGFLTEEEIQDVIDGTDIWLGEDEVLSRWNNRIAYLNPGLTGDEE